MSLDSAIYGKLTGTAGISNLVSTRVYPVLAPAGASMPAITYQRISTVEYTSHDGPSGLVRARYEIVAWSSTNVAARTLADLIRVTLDCTAWVQSSDTVQHGWRDSEELVYDDGTDADRPRFGVSMQFVFLHNEATT